MGVAVLMAVTVGVVATQVPPRGYCDPATKPHQRQTRDGIDPMPKARRHRRPAQPNNQCNRQSGKHMSEPGLERSSRSLRL